MFRNFVYQNERIWTRKEGVRQPRPLVPPMTMETKAYQFLLIPPPSEKSALGRQQQIEKAVCMCSVHRIPFAFLND